MDKMNHLSHRHLPRRPRRNRTSKVIRTLVEENSVRVEQLVCPLFIIEGENKKESIISMPEQFRFSLDKLLHEIEECMGLGIRSFVLFPAIEEKYKDKFASYSYSPDNFYLNAIQFLKKTFQNDICIITDVAMDPYNSDGHDGIFQNGKILNDETLSILVKMSIAQAQAGADILGPSDMMDGRIHAIRSGLDEAGHSETGIMAYTCKYASSLYWPFRDALDSAPKEGDKKTYQMSYSNQREALVEAELDYNEGADFLMVKPALFYLDIIHLLKQNFNIPIAAYNVSGEYSMMMATAANHSIPIENLMHELLVSIKRAGADIIITYFAKKYASQVKLNC